MLAPRISERLLHSWRAPFLEEIARVEAEGR
jgi:hypothetical protein